MPPVGIRGVGLSCALGLDARSSVTQLLAGGRAPQRVALDGLAEPVEITYFRIPDDGALFDPRRFERLLPAVVQAALAEAELDSAELRILPVYLGSSCFSVGIAESRYA